MARPYRRLIRNAAIAFAALLVLGVVAAIALLKLTDAERMRPRIEAEAAALLGREVSLGTLGWDINWRLGIESRGGRIANASGFEGEALARWERLQLGLALRPLLSRRVEIDRIDIDGLALDLQVDAAGKDNWTFIPARAPQDEPAASLPIAISALTLQGASLRYRDAGSGTDLQLQDMTLSLRPQFGEGLLPHTLQAVDMHARMAGTGLPANGVAIALATPHMELGEALWPISLPRFKARVDATQLEGELRLADADHITGRLAVAVPSLRGQLAAWGNELPVMQDAQVPGALQLSAQVDYAGDALQLQALSATLDGTHLTGDLQLPSLAPPALRFTLVADKVDIDRYLAPEGTPGDPFELPVTLLRSLDARGTLRVDKARFGGFIAHDITLTTQ